MGKIEFGIGTLTVSSIQKLPSGQEVNLKGAFNSTINTFVCNNKTNANLNVTIRIHFDKINPIIKGKAPHVDNILTRVEPWVGDEWEHWKRRFLNQTRIFWNKQFWLKTPATYNGLNWPERNPTHRCNLFCKLEIVDHPSSAGSHFTISVVKVKNWTQSDMFHWDSLDLKEFQKSQVMGIKQKGALHEVGHLIGLRHPGMGNPGCTLNEDACYFTSGGDDTVLMGKGNVIRDEDAKPWIMAAAALTGTNEGDWKVFRRYILPSPL